MQPVKPEPKDLYRYTNKVHVMRYQQKCSPAEIEQFFLAEGLNYDEMNRVMQLVTEEHNRKQRGSGWVELFIGIVALLALGVILLVRMEMSSAPRILLRVGLLAAAIRMLYGGIIKLNTK